MEGVEASIEDGSHHNKPDNIYVELNNQHSKLLQIVKDLKVELQTIKHYYIWLKSPTKKLK